REALDSNYSTTRHSKRACMLDTKMPPGGSVLTEAISVGSERSLAISTIVVILSRLRPGIQIAPLSAAIWFTTLSSMVAALSRPRRRQACAALAVVADRRRSDLGAHSVRHHRSTRREKTNE